MDVAEWPPRAAGLAVRTLTPGSDTIRLDVGTTSRSAACPRCGVPPNRIRGRFTRPDDARGVAGPDCGEGQE